MVRLSLNEPGCLADRLAEILYTKFCNEAVGSTRVLNVRLSIATALAPDGPVLLLTFPAGLDAAHRVPSTLVGRVARTVRHFAVPVLTSRFVGSCSHWYHCPHGFIPTASTTSHGLRCRRLRWHPRITNVLGFILLQFFSTPLGLIGTGGAVNVGSPLYKVDAADFTVLNHDRPANMSDPYYTQQYPTGSL